MFGSRARQARRAAAAKTQKAADDFRAETEEGVQNALRGPWPDREFAYGWTAQRSGEQAYLDGQASDAAKAAKGWRPWELRWDTQGRGVEVPAADHPVPGKTPCPMTTPEDVPAAETAPATLPAAAQLSEALLLQLTLVQCSPDATQAAMVAMATDIRRLANSWPLMSEATRSYDGYPDDGTMWAQAATDYGDHLFDTARRLESDGDVQYAIEVVRRLQFDALNLVEYYDGPADPTSSDEDAPAAEDTQADELARALRQFAVCIPFSENKRGANLLITDPESGEMHEVLLTTTAARLLISAVSGFAQDFQEADDEDREAAEDAYNADMAGEWAGVDPRTTQDGPFYPGDHEAVAEAEAAAEEGLCDF